MSSEVGSASVLVDTTLVGKEIFVDGESDSDWSSGGDFVDEMGSSSDGVVLVSLLQVRLVAMSIRRVTFSFTLRGVSITGTVWVLLGLDVMSTWSEFVRFAPSVVSVEIS